MILEREDKNRVTFINEETKSRYTIFCKQSEEDEERIINYHFQYENYTLFELTNNELKYDFMKFLNSKEVDEEDIEIFVSKYCNTMHFNYDVILKVFRCFLTDQNTVILNKENFIKKIIEEYKIIFETIIVYNLNNK